MLVSVVIPTLDRPKLLLRAIESVLRQTCREIEIIVVADRPDPETVSAVGAVDDPRLQLILNPHPSTAASARNFGADQATGDWIAFLDDDDEWLDAGGRPKTGCRHAAQLEDVGIYAPFCASAYRTGAGLLPCVL